MKWYDMKEKSEMNSSKMWIKNNYTIPLIPVANAFGECDKTLSVCKTAPKLVHSNSIFGSNRSLTLNWKTCWHVWRKFLILRTQRNCDIWGLRVTSLISIQPLLNVDNNWHSRTPSRRVWAKSITCELGQLHLWSAGKTPQLTNHLTHSRHRSSAIWSSFYFKKFKSKQKSYSCWT
jgi:hypothetical protein